MSCQPSRRSPASGNAARLTPGSRDRRLQLSHASRFVLHSVPGCIVSIALFAQIDRITGKHFATRSEVLARHGMVCTSVPLATQVGLDILKRGGSAVDAAIAANATLGLMEPVSNGIGGDLFAIVYSAKENKLYGLNGSGRSPLGLSYEQMKAELAKLNRKTIPPRGMLPISVPGHVDAWSELHKKFGKLSLSDDLAPARFIMPRKVFRSPS